MPWKMVSCSVQGTDHYANGVPCQDFSDYSYISDKDIAIGIVSDGAGSAKYSEQGSKIAVSETLQHARNLGEILHTLQSESQARNSLTHIISNVIERLEEEATKKNCSTDDFACTLIIFIANSDCLIAMQIGDGFIVLKSKEELYYRLLFMPDKGEFTNETTFITSKNAIENAHFYYAPIKLEFICASTDGIDHASLDKTKGTNWKPHQKFFKPLHEELNTVENPETISETIAKFLDSDSFAKITGDDKTVVLALHQSNPVNSEWNSSHPYRIVRKTSSDPKIIPEPTVTLSPDNTPEETNERPRLQNYINILEARISKKNLFYISIITCMLGMTIFLTLTYKSTFTSNNKPSEEVNFEKYTYKIYPLHEELVKSIGFLVINPNSLPKSNQKFFEAWFYFPSSSQINTNKRVVTFPNHIKTLIPIYRIGNQQGSSTNLSIGYLYPGTSFNYLSIDDSKKGNTTEKRAKIRFVLGK